MWGRSQSHKPSTLLPWVRGRQPPVCYRILKFKITKAIENQNIFPKFQHFPGPKTQFFAKKNFEIPKKFYKTFENFTKIILKFIILNLYVAAESSVIQRVFRLNNLSSYEIYHNRDKTIMDLEWNYGKGWKFLKNFAENRMYFVEEFNICNMWRISSIRHGKFRKKRAKPWGFWWKSKKYLKNFRKFWLIEKLFEKFH